MKTKWIAILGMASLPLQTAFGAFVLVEDFNARTIGAINGQNGWTAVGSGTGGALKADESFNVIDNPLAGGSDQLLEIKKGTVAGSMFAYKNFASSIANTSTATTVYFRMYSVSATLNIAAGTAETPSAAFGDFATVGRLSSTTGLDVYNGNAAGGAAAAPYAGYLTVDTTPLQGKWYDIWMDVNNSADTWQMYYSEDGGTRTLAAAGSPSISTFTLRNGGAQAINAFMVATSQVASATTSYIDDIYIDTTGFNAISPVPEPSAVLIGGLGMLTLLRRRRA